MTPSSPQSAPATPAKQSPERDLLALASAPIRELTDAVAASVRRETGDEPDAAARPRRSLQIAELILAEAVRLIRLGAIADLADQAAHLARATSGSRGRRLREAAPSVHRRLYAAALVLDAAASPASRGGEIAVLRSWSGNAREVVRAVAASPGHSITRAELRDRFEMSESHMSHLLADLEAAALVVRIRHGRNVMVHLGPRSAAPHVVELLEGVDAARADRRDRGPAQAEPRFLRAVPAPGRPLPTSRGSGRPAHLFAGAAAVAA